MAKIPIFPEKTPDNEDEDFVISALAGRRASQAQDGGSQIKRLARSINNGASGERRNGRGRRDLGAKNGDTMQRVVVKCSHTRHQNGPKNRSPSDILRKHAAYLIRETASADGEPGRVYSATDNDNGLDLGEHVGQWADDRHHFRMIISPENGDQIQDREQFIRRIMAKVEQDLGAKVEWYAVDHHNTDDPHSHVMMRGVDDKGQDLVIDRKYITEGIRFRAREVATELLGERTKLDIETAWALDIESLRWTYLDRVIKRNKDQSGEIKADNRSIFGQREVKSGCGKKMLMSTSACRRTWPDDATKKFVHTGTALGTSAHPYLLTSIVAGEDDHVSTLSGNPYQWSRNRDHSGAGLGRESGTEVDRRTKTASRGVLRH